MSLSKNATRIGLIIVYLMIAATACSPTPEAAMEDAVNATLTASAVEAQQTEEQAQIQPSSTPEQTDFPAKAQCSEFGTLIEQYIRLVPTINAKNFDDAAVGLTGAGCEVSFEGDGSIANTWGADINALTQAIPEQGWIEDFNFFGAGASGSISVYRKDGVVCQMLVESGPVDLSLCSSDEPLYACMERLAPEQKQYLVNVGCTPDSNPSEPTAQADVQPQTDVITERIQFASNYDRYTTPGGIPPLSGRHYVLWASQGQQMNVQITTDPLNSAVLTVRGADGTVLLSDQAGAVSWIGDLPSTQDYYISIISQSGESIGYQLTVIIPPTDASQTVTNRGANQTVYPIMVPANFDLYMQAFYDSGAPVMLPPSFPDSGTDLAIYPSIFNIGTNLYEANLEYGADCQGGGACHYGSLSAMPNTSGAPLSTPTFAYDAGQAVPVSLDRGIQGYFIQGACGASCSDSYLFWIYNNYQYSLAIKSTDQQMLINTANAMLTNSVRY